MEVEDFERAGLYDRGLPNPEERLALLRLLAAEGATIEEMQAALADDRLIGLAVDAVVRPPGDRFTFAEMCDRAGLESADGASLLRAAGLAQPEPNDRVFTDADVRCFRFLSMMALLGEGHPELQVTRVAGTAMSSLAEAELAAVRSSFEGPLRAAGAGEHQQAQSLRAIAGMLPEVLNVLDVFHRRHLLVGMRARVLWESGRPNLDAAVGFADLVGYTALVQSVDSAELTTMIERFETAAREVLAEAGGRLVKLIGDEVMFQAPTADAGCRIAVRLLGTVAADPSLPELRIGLAFGRVRAFEGDYYGRPVNEAARLVRDAEIGSALITGAVRDATTTRFDFTPAGSHALKGIGGVDAYRLIAD